MNLIVVYKGSGKIAADQLKKLVKQKDDIGEKIIGTKDGTVDIIPYEVVAMEEKVWQESSRANPINDPVLFIDNVRMSSEIIPIANPKEYGYGVICGFAGPQAVLTVNPKALKKVDDYDEFLKELNSLTFQQISKVPRGFKWVKEALAHGVQGIRKKNDDLKKQQLIYGVTKLYYEDLREFMESYGQGSY